MKRISPLLLSASLLAAAAMPVYAADTGAIIGGAIGGATGAAVGQNVGGSNGAIIGAAIGGATGAAIGSGSNTSQPQRVYVSDDRYRDDDRDNSSERYYGHDKGNHYGWYKGKGHH